MTASHGEYSHSIWVTTLLLSPCWSELQITLCITGTHKVVITLTSESKPKWIQEETHNVISGFLTTPILLLQAPDTENWILGHQADIQKTESSRSSASTIPDFPLLILLWGCFPFPIPVTVNHKHAGPLNPTSPEQRDHRVLWLPRHYTFTSTPTPFFTQVFPWTILSSPSSLFPL
mgnify:CR=1 FL=1